eukprot:CAMPEP_0171220222 /NCGR_PEP_ID=MMETSP0790-20130122/34125_1 /TAXON_ID=2925 /ORGANISM="Alexandrium catenella, Strain OF101" /LENGTH=156 /DNA_ID=CAMNT_0011686107 /DNA_START=111 /DNA_END=578 /DNA_ORIENTATION=-
MPPGSSDPWSAGADPWSVGAASKAPPSNHMPMPHMGSMGKGGYGPPQDFGGKGHGMPMWSGGGGYGKGGFNAGGKGRGSTNRSAGRVKMTTKLRDWHVKDASPDHDYSPPPAENAAPSVGRGRAMIAPAWKTSTILGEAILSTSGAASSAGPSISA